MPFTPAFRARLCSGRFTNKCKNDKNHRRILKKLIKQYDDARRDSIHFHAMECALETADRENERLRTELAKTKTQLSAAKLSVTNGELAQAKKDLEKAAEEFDNLQKEIQWKKTKAREHLQNALAWLSDDSDA